MTHDVRRLLLPLVFALALAPADDLSDIGLAHMTHAIRSMFAPVLWLANSPFKPDWLPGQTPVQGGRGRG